MADLITPNNNENALDRLSELEMPVVLNMQVDGPLPGTKIIETHVRGGLTKRQRLAAMFGQGLAANDDFIRIAYELEEKGGNKTEFIVGVALGFADQLLAITEGQPPPEQTPKPDLFQR